MKKKKFLIKITKANLGLFELDKHSRLVMAKLLKQLKLEFNDKFELVPAVDEFPPDAKPPSPPPPPLPLPAATTAIDDDVDDDEGPPLADANPPSPLFYVVI